MRSVITVKNKHSRHYGKLSRDSEKGCPESDSTNVCRALVLPEHNT
jgi:hypothetical protein